MDQNSQLKYLDSLGIPIWVPRDFTCESADEIDAPAQTVSDVDNSSITRDEPAETINLTGSTMDTLTMDDVGSMSWSDLNQAVAECQACELHTGRTQTVFGTGNQNASLMVIGEAPGADEDAQGEPFVGRAGQLLDLMIKSIGYPRPDVYIANIVKCRPPDNRNPRDEEALQCIQYLHRQVALVKPKAILAVGKIAAQNLLQSDLPVGKMRGNQYHYALMNIPVIVTYHPAYLLRSPREKAKVWQDLKLVRELL